MSNQDLLMPDDSKELATAPDYAQAEEGATNLLGDMGGASFTRLTFKGSRFRIVHGEEETVLDETKLPVVMLDAYPKVSRVYFKGTFGEDTADARPACASADGEVPLPTVVNPPAATCMSCPMNEKGSAISDDGGKRRACSFYKRTVLLLLDYIDLGPVVCDVKALGLFGQGFPDKGYLNLRAYADKLAQHQTKPHAVITELSFDTNSSVPKLLFRALSYVDEAMYFESIEPLIESGVTGGLADTTQMRTSDMQGDATAPQGGGAEGGGFRDKLLENKPAHAEEEKQEEAPAKTTKKVTKKVAKKKVTKKVAKKVAAKPEPEPEPELEHHAPFCGECGSKWGECDHTATKVNEEAPTEEDGETQTEFDAELDAAMAEYEG